MINDTDYFRKLNSDKLCSPPPSPSSQSGQIYSLTVFLSYVSLFIKGYNSYYPTRTILYINSTANNHFRGVKFIVQWLTPGWGPQPYGTYNCVDHTCPCVLTLREYLAPNILTYAKIIPKHKNKPYNRKLNCCSPQKGNKKGLTLRP